MLSLLLCEVDIFMNTLQTVVRVRHDLCHVTRIGPGREKQLSEGELSYGYAWGEGAAQMAFLKRSFIQEFRSALRIQPHWWR